MLRNLNPRRQFILSLLFAMAVSIGLFGYGAYHSQSLRYDYLVWNLFLAAVPLVIAIRLVHVLRSKRWSAWEPMGWSLLWLMFVPNSFYMISDFIHLRNVAQADILYATVLFTSLIYLGVLLGFCSLILIHHELRRRLHAAAAYAWIAGALLVCSFAIYIGRDLRWNSWDVIFNPAGLLFDISDRVLRPEDYPTMFVTVISFFALLISLYSVVWAGARLLRLVDPHQASAFPQLAKRRS
ncbi:MAG: hypothetical protein JWN82_342 [Candidatus Saccharibacteria bacterium]|nr:hypothetical protein [Candidatus Saccharibacteria bacterium]